MYVFLWCCKCDGVLVWNRTVKTNFPLGTINHESESESETFHCGGMQDVCESIHDELSSDCGYHEDCRRMFFRNANRALSKCQAETSSTRPTREHVDSSVLFCSYCIFCRSSIVKKVSRNRYSLQKFQSNAYKNISCTMTP